MRETVALCVNIISSRRKLALLSYTAVVLIFHPTASQDAHAVLLRLLKSVPAFWGEKELTQVISTYARHWAAAPHGTSEAMNSLMRAVAKHVPSKMLLSSLVDMWPAYKDASEQVGIRSCSCMPPLKGIQKEICAYFDVMTRALRVAERPLILELLRQLNKIFLESFDVISAEEGQEVRDVVNNCMV
jgi:U3 small nucleolar RNA-associated protein 10